MDEQVRYDKHDLLEALDGEVGGLVAGDGANSAVVSGWPGSTSAAARHSRAGEYLPVEDACEEANPCGADASGREEWLEKDLGSSVGRSNGRPPRSLVVRNPFIRRDAPMTVWGAVRLALGTLILVPVRAALSVLLVGAACVVAALLTFPCLTGRARSARLTGWRRRWLAATLQALARTTLWVFGVFRIEERSSAGGVRRGEHVPGNWILVSNHVSFFDILYFVYAFAPSFVAKAQVRQLPLIGIITAALQGIFVDREQHTTASATEQVVRRVTAVDAADYPPLLLFPEGTTSNNEAVLRFHSGAFVPGVPVVPFALRYRFGQCDPAFVGLSPWTVLCILAEPCYALTVHCLPVYRPSAGERADPRRYAESVRRLLARSLGVEPLDLGYRERFTRQLSRTRLQMIDLAQCNGCDSTHTDTDVHAALLPV
ncbi:hypothetical protein CDCA_CDCA17G4470 [Cyanidium caldarium]|uniref:Phospholipid/glycerol acyltransferase domain-containing protein n=1 Tax=Cyanidium caldarium TaxID=2771 RepID=A0AAV9J1I7_CYACA|nr:hypothetical protein CDCA_CDCA17G4470 [Cyanidium caldarium]